MSTRKKGKENRDAGCREIHTTIFVGHSFSYLFSLSYQVFWTNNFYVRITTLSVTYSFLLSLSSRVTLFDTFAFSLNVASRIYWFHLILLLPCSRLVQNRRNVSFEVRYFLAFFDLGSVLVASRSRLIVILYALGIYLLSSLRLALVYCHHD